MTHPNPLAFSFFAADFITGVPKGLMLYGVVRSPYIFILFKQATKQKAYTYIKPRPGPLVKKPQ